MMFVIVRHGNNFAAGETPRRIGARTDLPLVEAGREQARSLGRHFAEKGWHFSHALVSPLLRTQETARLVLESQDEPVETQACEWLREIDHGPDENLPEDAVIARIGRDALQDWEKSAVAPPDWEVDAEMRLDGWRKLYSCDPADGPVLLVTSNGAARFALMAEPSLAAAAQELETLKLSTGGYGVIQRATDGALSLDAWGLRP